MSDTWTDARIERLTALWESGVIARLIADELGGGITKAAVIGKGRRLGLSTRQIERTPEERKAAKAEKDKIRHAKAKGQSKAKPRKSTLFQMFTAPPSDDLRRYSLDIPFEKLEDHHCRFAYEDGPFLFCGQHKQDGSSFCAGHHSMCWTVRNAPLPQARKYFGTDFSVRV